MADLKEYRRRRDAKRTPEPVPEAVALLGGTDDTFVIQEHHARRLHYDVRLEREGVLVSWAVPKGLLMKTGTVRLAVHTEDHPMEYATFEGTIPKGEYGAGRVSIWDKGRYDTIRWDGDEIEVVLHGSRVDGRYVFFRKSSAEDPRAWMVRRAGAQRIDRKSVTADIEGRQLKVTNLSKVLYPATGFTKAEVIDYYRRVAPILLRHLAGRPVTFRRYPDGVGAQSFFEKDVSRHAPDWVRTMRLPTPGSAKGAASADFAMIDDLPSLVWAANLAAIELHVPQWTIGVRGGRRPPDLIVFDLDPGAPATIVDCCRVAEMIRYVLATDGLTGYPKTSGSKGLQLYVPVRVTAAGQTSRYARAVAAGLAEEHPDQVLAVMAKARRTGKVLIDWSQNNPAKTTVAPYSLRAREAPTVSTPVTWQEVQRCRRREDLVFTAEDVLDRIDEHGDLLADLHRDPGRLPRRGKAG
ncbi:MAG: non-homologous end-joining DNA ligase [Kutzneria sp.]|nr:non-homologous end-joining DNA ligase [Kutzneria sp.]MBV9846605.1 non-homologous end-joining DNA ligase [Kutzneria sp.]